MIVNCDISVLPNNGSKKLPKFSDESFSYSLSSEIFIMIFHATEETSWAPESVVCLIVNPQVMS